MRRTKSGLVHVVHGVRDFFAENAAAGEYNADTLTVTGAPPTPAAFTFGASTPLGDYDVQVRFTFAGTVGTTGITYQTSIDGGQTFAAVKELGTATEIAIPATGVALELGAGHVDAGELVTFQTSGPRMNAVVRLGWRDQSRQINQGPGLANRVVFTPGDDSGRDGSIHEPQRVGGNPRPLWDWTRMCIVSMWAVDPPRPADEEAQIEAVERLWEDVMQAVQVVGAGLTTWGGPIWTKPQEQQFGKELRAPLFLRTVFFDLENPRVFPAPKVVPVLEDS